MVFRCVPWQWQLSSLHPMLVQLDAMRSALLHPVHWCFRSGENVLLHSLQLADIPGMALKDIQSAYGYGGPLANTEDEQFLRAAEQAWSGWTKQNAVIAEFLRFHPLVPHARWYAGHVADNRETVYIDLGTELFEQYRTTRRTDVRRFLEGEVRVEQVSSALMSTVFPALYRDNMDQVAATSDYYFSAAYFEALFRFEEADNWLVYFGDVPIAGAVILSSDQARVVEYFLGAQAGGFQHHRPMIGLLHFVARYYQARAFRYFYLGGGRSVDPKDSLLFFKRGFSSLTGRYQIGSRVYDPEDYSRLQQLMPAKAASGRVLFYRD